MSRRGGGTRTIATALGVAMMLSGCRWFGWGAIDHGQLGNGATTAQLTPIGTPQRTHWVSVDAGLDFGCGIDANAVLHCWGANDVGQVSNVAFGATVTRPAVVRIVGSLAGIPWARTSAGGTHACGIIAGRTDLYCWGANSAGQLGNPTAPSPSTPVRVGTTSGWSAVTAGVAHTCGIHNGELWCWGANGDGQLGDGSTTQRTAPVRIGTTADWTSVSAGNVHTCGIRAGGQLWCWGNNLAGVFGDGTRSSRTAPTRIGTATDWTVVSTYSIHTCGIRAGGQLWCAGQNFHGGLGDGTTAERLAFTRVGADADWNGVAVGQYHTCGTRGAGSLWCWGEGLFGELGVDSFTDRLSPTRVGIGSDWTVTAGFRHSCGVRRDHADLQCFGTAGSLGDLSTRTRPVPVYVGEPADWNQLSAGGDHTCGVSADKSLWCWGKNDYGQVGDGSPNPDEPGPARLSAEDDWTDVAAGSYHSCAIRANSALWCWGRNLEGQIGNNSTTSRNVPIQIGGGPWIAVSTGHVHTCAIQGASSTATTGTLWCWGWNGNGRLGDATTTRRLGPTQVGTGSDWSTVSAGGFHTCGIRATALYCWGANADGQLGLGRNGTPSGTATPVLVAGGSSGWTTVAAGSNHTCGLNSGQVWCWGQNLYGQVGDGSGLNRTIPTRIGAASGWSALGVGMFHSCGVRARTLNCWGWNASGQVGDGTTVDRLAPVQVGTKTDWNEVDGGYGHTVGSRNVPPGE